MSPLLLVRVLILLAASVNLGLWLFAPSSLTARLEQATGQDVFQLFFSVIVVLGWLDILINDVLPKRVVSHTLLTYRHLLYAVAGAAFLIKAFVGASAESVSTSTGGAFVILLSFLATACVCAWYVFIEVIGTPYAQR
jgi:hypothetical protein